MERRRCRSIFDCKLDSFSQLLTTMILTNYSPCLICMFDVFYFVAFACPVSDTLMPSSTCSLCGGRFIRKKLHQLLNSNPPVYRCDNCRTANFKTGYSACNATKTTEPIFFPTLTVHSHLSFEKRAAIITMNKLGYTKQDICDAIACSLPTVNHWIKHYDQHFNIGDQNRNGRPRILTKEVEQNIVEAASQVFEGTKGKITPREIKHQLGLFVSSRTVRRRLNENGLYDGIAASENDYTEEQLNQREAWGEGYIHFTQDDWNRIIFTDEKDVTCDSKAGKVHVQRPAGHRYDPSYMTKHHTHTKSDPPVKISIIAGVCAKGFNFIHTYTDELNSKRLIRMLNEHLVSSAERLYRRGGDWSLLWDNDSTHTSNETRAWLQQGLILQHIIKIPARSPDLNYIENVWPTLAAAVEKHNCRTQEQLIDAVLTEWPRIESKVGLKKIGKTMIDRCKALIQNHGHYTGH
jgi:transposase